MKYQIAQRIPSINRRNWPQTKFTLLMAVLCISVGCITAISYYDATTYQNLTELKPEVVFLYETFKNDDVDETHIQEVRLHLAQVYEYEKGKGASNEDTRKQAKIIWDMFDDHVEDRVETGKWTDAHFENNKQNIEDAFDIAIQTERLKNKNE